MNIIRIYFNHVCYQAVLFCAALILAFLACSYPAYCQSEIEITDNQGSKHIVSGCQETTGFYESGTPFFQASCYRGAPLLNKLIAINMYTQSEQDKITNIAIKNGYHQNVDDDDDHVILLIPQSAIDDIKFSDDKSIIRLAGGISFDAGKGYGYLKGIEGLSALRHGEFSLSMKDVTEIKCPMSSPFVGGFSFFAANEIPPEVDLVNGGISIIKPLDLSTALPFEVKITDNTGAKIILDEALFCDVKEILTGRRDKDGYYFNEPCYTVCFMSDMRVTFSGGYQRLIPVSTLSKVRPGRDLSADVTFLSGETVNDTLTNDQSGIIGYCSKGWVWIPWIAISELDFRNKYQIAKDAVHDDDLEMIKVLVKKNSDLVYSKDKDGYTLLHWAAIIGNKDVAELLMANKADVNGIDVHGWTPLHYAIENGHKNVADLLMVNKAEVNIGPTIEQRARDADAPYNSGHYLVANIISIKEGDENAIIGRQDNGDYFKATVLGWNVLTRRDLKSPLLQNVKNDLKSKIENPLIWLINRESLKDKDYNSHYQTLLNNARLALFGKTKGTAVLTLSNPNIPDSEILGNDGKIDPVKFALANLTYDTQVHAQ